MDGFKEGLPNRAGISFVSRLEVEDGAFRAGLTRTRDSC